MKVGELKKVISNLPNNAEVFLNTTCALNTESAQKAEVKAVKTKEDQKHMYLIISG